MPSEKRVPPAPAFVRNSAYLIGLSAIPVLWVMAATGVLIPLPVTLVTAVVGLYTIGFIFTGAWPHQELWRLLKSTFLHRK